MKHDNDTIVRDIRIATGAVTAAWFASLAGLRTCLYRIVGCDCEIPVPFLHRYAMETFRFPSIADFAGTYRKTSAG